MTDALRDLAEPEDWEGVQALKKDGREYHLGYAEVDKISVIEVTDPQRQVGYLVDAELLHVASIERQRGGRWSVTWQGMNITGPDWRGVIDQLQGLWASDT